MHLTIDRNMSCRRLTAAVTLAATALAGAPPVARADTITIDAAGSGWYASSGWHETSNRNYVVHYYQGFRNFFAFDLTPVSGPVTAATLRLFTFDTDLTGPMTYSLFDVSHSWHQVNAGYGVGGDPAGQVVHADLGSGNMYGSRTYTTADKHQFASISLNAAFVADVNAAVAGQHFLLGGSATSVTGANDLIFGASMETATTWDIDAQVWRKVPAVQLVLEVAPNSSVPTPSPAAAGLALIGPLAIRRRTAFQ